MRDLEIVEKFCVHVRETAEKENILCIFAPTSHVQFHEEKSLVNGYFDDHHPTQGRVLAVGMGKPMELWLPVLVHESCHMDQCLEDSPVWKAGKIPDSSLDVCDMVFEWLERKRDFPPAEIDDYIRRTRNVERDCEMRTIKKIREFNLPIDPHHYARGANSYLFFYTAMKETRSWYKPGREPYNTEDILKLVPTEILDEPEYEVVPPDLMDAYRRLLA